MLIDFNEQPEIKQVIKEYVETRVANTGKARTDFFPAKLHISMTFYPVKTENKTIYAVSYVFTESIEWRKSIYFIYLDSGIIVGEDLIDISKNIVDDFLPYLDQKSL